MRSKLASENLGTSPPMGRPTSVAISLKSLVAARVKRLIRKPGSRNTMATSVMLSRLARSLLAASSSCTLSRSWLLTVLSSSLSDWNSSSMDVCNPRRWTGPVRRNTPPEVVTYLFGGMT